MRGKEVGTTNKELACQLCVTLSSASRHLGHLAKKQGGHAGVVLGVGMPPKSGTSAGGSG
jgi:hypothetical protein